MNKEDTKPKHTGEDRARLLSILVPYKGFVALLVILAMAASAINLIIPGIIASAIDAYTANNFDSRWIITQFMVAASGIFIFTLLQGVLQTYTAERVARDLRTKIVDKLSIQSFSFIQESNPSKLLTNLTSDMRSVKIGRAHV